MESVIEKWSGRVLETVIGADDKSGGTRGSIVKVGGETTLPFLHSEGDMPNSPVVALEVWDTIPEDWPQSLKEPFSSCLNDPIAWAKKNVEEFGAELICLKLMSTHPDRQNRSPQEAAQILKSVLGAVRVPLIVVGSGDREKDGDVILACSEAARGENCIFGIAVQENYKTITAACLSAQSGIIAESPIDINLAKQLNILVSDMGFPLEKIVMHHATGALGYGLEYTYSILERTRLAALQGDTMMSMPMINFVGQEVWKLKEAKTSREEIPQWGSEKERGIYWEIITAVSLIQAGCDILVMNHPLASKEVKGLINKLMKKS